MITWVRREVIVSVCEPLERLLEGTWVKRWIVISGLVRVVIVHWAIVLRESGTCTGPIVAMSSPVA